MINIKVIKSLDNKQWDDFVFQSNSGTIFHTLKFLSYHLKNKFIFHNLAFYKNDTLIAVLPGTLENNVFRSPQGASYGSFVTNNISFSEYEEIIDSFLEYAAKNKIAQIYLTPPPIFYQKNPNEIENFLLIYKNFEIKHHLITNAVSLDIFSDNVLGSFTIMHKRAVKKSLKENLHVEFSKNINEFYPMLLKNKAKFDTTPTHTKKELTRLQSLFPEKIKLLMAYTKDGKPIGAILLFVCNPTTLLAFYICHYYEYQELRAVNRLFYEAIIWAKSNNFKWFDLGVSMDTKSDNPMEPGRSLIYFKEGIMTRGFLRTTYYKKL